MDYNNFDCSNLAVYLKDLKILAKGAEAIVYEELWNNMLTVVKKRLPKLYRKKEFDEKIIKRRTKIEANIIKKLASYVKVPKIYEVGDDFIRMEFIKGEKPEINEENAKLLGSLIFDIHKADIVHNDFTVANVIMKEDKQAYVIDFGLAFHSKRIEDKASCLYCTYASFGKYKNYVLDAYREKAKTEEEKKMAKNVIERLEDIRKRMRYV